MEKLLIYSEDEAKNFLIDNNLNEPIRQPQKPEKSEQEELNEIPSWFIQESYTINEKNLI